MAHAKCCFSYVLELPAGHRCPEHSHPCTELVFCRDCAGTLTQGDRSHEYGDGSVFVYQPGPDHFIENRKPGHQLCIGVLGCGAERLRDGITSGTPAIAARAMEFEKAFQEGGPAQDERLDLLAGLLALEVCAVQGALHESAETHALKARHIIDHRFHEPLNVGLIARQIYVSPDYLRQLFRAEFGVSPLHYLIQKRIEHARRLLESTALPVQEIAGASGFHNPYYFSRMFKKITGISPSSCRMTRQGH